RLVSFTIAGWIMLQLNAISHRFADHLLFENLTLSINRADRLGLIGPNGSVKSTLLGIIAGRISPSSGSGTWSAHTPFGMVPLGAFDIESGTLREVVDVAAGGYFSALSELDLATAALSGPEGAEEHVLTRWERAQEAYDIAGGY